MEEKKTYSENDRDERMNNAFERLIRKTNVDEALNEGKKKPLPPMNNKNNRRGK